jgi:hypothetical protein
MIGEKRKTSLRYLFAVMWRFCGKENFGVKGYVVKEKELW